MIDHVTLRVHDLATAKAFYAAALAPLGYAVIAEYPEAIGLGVAGKPDLWLAADPSAAPQHVAFAAASRAVVDAFHAAGLEAGGRDNGAPGLRVHYHPDYYGAFVDDPTGHHLEAVIHTRPGGARKAAGKSPVKRSPAKKAPARKAPAKQAARKATPRKAAARKRR